ncbi:alpha/beta hydrolase [Dactylosporangium sp. NPDC000244]|uniref:alpha/beta fold hydrolase n=1 Tax=Dactylosporangium sp. NPDC000244 TaxID=3154365 RepID=UPI00331BA55B
MTVFVLVHGLDDTPDSWAPLTAALEGEAITLELPWRAGADVRWRRDGTAGAWLRRRLRALGTPYDVLIGHSLGANAVLDVLAGGTDAAAAVLIAPLYRPPDWGVTWDLFTLCRQHFEAVIRERGRALDRRRETDPAAVDELLDRIIDRLGPARFITLFEEFVATGDLPLGAVTVPTLVLSGADDPGLSFGRAEGLASALPHATLVLDTSLRHDAHATQAETVARHIRGYLSARCLTGSPRHSSAG